MLCRFNEELGSNTEEEEKDLQATSLLKGILNTYFTIDASNFFPSISGSLSFTLSDSGKWHFIPSTTGG